MARVYDARRAWPHQDYLDRSQGLRRAERVHLLPIKPFAASRKNGRPTENGATCTYPRHAAARPEISLLPHAAPKPCRLALQNQTIPSASALWSKGPRSDIPRRRWPCAPNGALIKKRLSAGRALTSALGLTIMSGPGGIPAEPERSIAPAGDKERRIMVAKLLPLQWSSCQCLVAHSWQP